MLTLNAFLGGGGIHGVVVDKIFKPLPVVDSLGVEGIYDLELRDGKNQLHRQMVTREIFARYQIGDVFDDHAGAKQIVKQAASAVSTAKVQVEKTAAEKPKFTAAVVTPTPAPKAVAEQPAPPKTESRVAQAFQKGDMLPDEEGF